MGSEDIRIQLPEDVQRFDNVDKEFKSMMVTMAQTPNVVKERLQNMGFTSAQITEALKRHKDVAACSEWILTNPG